MCKRTRAPFSKRHALQIHTQVSKEVMIKFNPPNHARIKSAHNPQMIFQQEEHLKAEHNLLSDSHSQSNQQELQATAIL